MVNMPEHYLVKWLDSIPHSYSISSTLSFINKIKELKFTNDVKLVSFDVASLFCQCSNRNTVT